MEHPSIIRPSDHAEWRSDRMGKTTLFQSKRLLIGLNSFEPDNSIRFIPTTGWTRSTRWLR
jgi:hypothetical protein